MTEPEALALYCNFQLVRARTEPVSNLHCLGSKCKGWVKREADPNQFYCNYGCFRESLTKMEEFL